MKETNEFEELLMKKLGNRNIDEDILKKISKSIALLRTKGYSIERVLDKGKPPYWRSIEISGRIPIDKPIDPNDWLIFDKLKWFPRGIPKVEVLQFDATTLF